MIGFGSGKQQLVDNRRKQPAEQGALPVMETLHQLGQCQTHIVKRLRPAVERLQTVHQHNLPVEAQEVLFVEPLHHPFAIVFVAFAQHAGVAVFIGLRQLGFADGVDVGPREKLQRRRARHFSGQDKAPGLDKVQPFTLTGVEIVRPGGSDIRQPSLVGRG
ncbi:Uncharacterised protein [Klebsiella pneumoniae]|nr:Uncharacterised protein [Klebsiella pneumoniae]